MQTGPYRFDRTELAGSLGDLGTLVPLVTALVALGKVNPITAFLLLGIFYILSGLYYRVPVPIQPLKALAAIAIGSQAVSPSMVSAASITIGAFLLILARMDLIGKIAGIFSKPIVRGVQLGIGLILMLKGISFLISSRLFWNGVDKAVGVGEARLPFNWILALLGIGLVCLLRNNVRLPASIAVILLGTTLGIILDGGDSLQRLHRSSSTPDPILPSLRDFSSAFFLLVIPQIPLTLGNAVFAASDTAKSFFGCAAKRATPKALATTIGSADVVAGFLGGMPICHGAGGLAAHYRFGARTGGSLIMLGSLLVILTLASGGLIVGLLGLIPLSVLGVLLLFAGFQMSSLVSDLENRFDLLIAIAMGITAVATKNMSIALGVGLIGHWVARRAKKIPGISKGLGRGTSDFKRALKEPEEILKDADEERR